jgi:hypothetical protein
MDIYLIWATDGEAIWLAGAWDDESRAENPQGWEEELEKHRKSHGAENVRVAKAVVDFYRVEDLFSVPDLGHLK